MISRRAFLLAAGAAAWAGPGSGLKIGVMDGVLGLTGKPDAVAAARSFGLEGLQVTLGRTPDGGGLMLEDAALQRAFLAASEKQRLPLDATYIDILHTNCLKNDPKARGLVVKGIEVTRKLQARILMTVFFGQCSVDHPSGARLCRRRLQGTGAGGEARRRYPRFRKRAQGGRQRPRP